MKKFFFAVQWIYNKCNNSIPYIILLTIIGSIASLISVNIALITKSLIDSTTTSNTYNINKYIIIMAVLLLLNLILDCVKTMLNTLGLEKTRNQMQKSIYNHLILTRLSDSSKYHSVELLTRMTNDVQTIVNVLVTIIPNMFSFSVMFIFSFFALLNLSPQMALIAMIIFPVLIFLSKIYSRKLKHFYLEVQKNETECNRFLQESLNNILIIKSFCLESVRMKDLSILLNNRLNISFKRSFFSCISNGFFSLSSVLSYFFVFIWGSINLSANNAATNFGSLTAMLQLFSNMQTPISVLASSFPQLISAISAIDRLKELEESQLENTVLLPVRNINNANLTEDLIKYINPYILLKNVSFEYVNNKIILDNISVSINPGETIALIGRSGEGKTTLIMLILSLLYPTKGNLYINQDKLSPFHRHLISYVPQGNTLFYGSILSNLTFGNENIAYDEVITALKMSCAYDFVSALDNKLDTIIGEKGCGLSEGQAQRLTIARALLRKKPILILDEATSSLDPQTELNVINQIKKIQPKPICIIITHRPSALSICDRVFNLENKKLILVNT
ncbi:ABC transporter ATP-binding protein [Clostridium sp. C2-6-12]|uniref:ABC transporter ATP-binding protein n=1 Tax=Clostridium sp. C2-6-12 TaxID=2698832 RepID=UPI00136CEB22|nr:ABC transporter ATP-binding protein [Clostridium sp. C2-6-12]